MYFNPSSEHKECNLYKWTKPGACDKHMGCHKNWTNYYQNDDHVCSSYS